MRIRNVIRNRLPGTFIMYVNKHLGRLTPPSNQMLLSMKHLDISADEKDTMYKQIESDYLRYENTVKYRKAARKTAIRAIPSNQQVPQVSITYKRNHETRDSRIGKREFLPHIQHLTGVRTWSEFFKRFSRVQRLSFVTGTRDVVKIHFIDGHYISLVLDSARNAYELGVTEPDTNDFTSAFFPDEDKGDYLMYNVDPLRFMVVMKKLSKWCGFYDDSINTQVMGRLTRNYSLSDNAKLAISKLGENDNIPSLLTSVAEAQFSTNDPTVFKDPSITSMSTTLVDNKISHEVFRTPLTGFLGDLNTAVLESRSAAKALVLTKPPLSDMTVEALAEATRIEQRQSVSNHANHDVDSVTSDGWCIECGAVPSSNDSYPLPESRDASKALLSKPLSDNLIERMVEARRAAIEQSILQRQADCDHDTDSLFEGGMCCKCGKVFK